MPRKVSTRDRYKVVEVLTTVEEPSEKLSGTMICGAQMSIWTSHRAIWSCNQTRSTNNLQKTLNKSKSPSANFRLIRNMGAIPVTTSMMLQKFTTVCEEVTAIALVACSNTHSYVYALFIYSITHNAPLWSLKYLGKVTHRTWESTSLPKTKLKQVPLRVAGFLTSDSTRNQVLWREMSSGVPCQPQK